MLITSELSKSFIFISEQLTDLCFYNYPEAVIICRDFLKSLRASIALKTKQDLFKKKQVKDEDDLVEINNIQEEVDNPELQYVINLLEDDTTVINIDIDSDSECTLLQLCK